MERLDSNFVLKIANTIWAQIKGIAGIPVVCSWGVKNVRATQLLVPYGGGDCFMAALAFDVNGFQYKGTVIVGYDEGADYYRIFKQEIDGDLKQIHKDVCFDELANLLDTLIETGNMTQEEYNSKIEKAYSFA